MSPLSILLGVDLAKRADLDIHFWLRAVLGSIALVGLLVVLDWFLGLSARPPRAEPGIGGRRLIRAVSIPMTPFARTKGRATQTPSRGRPRTRPRDSGPPSPSA